MTKKGGPSPNPNISVKSRTAPKGPSSKPTGGKAGGVKSQSKGHGAEKKGK